MYQSILGCPICYENYDLDQHVPRIICCGHTLCSKCISRMLGYEQSDVFKCPMDKCQFLLTKRKSSCFPKNLALIQLIESAHRSALCSDHHRRLQWLCADENVYLCPKCVVLGGHQKHNIKRIEAIPIENERFILKKNNTKVILVQDQPCILPPEGTYEKIEVIKGTIVKITGLTLALFLILHPFFKLFSHENNKTYLAFD